MCSSKIYIASAKASASDLTISISSSLLLRHSQLCLHILLSDHRNTILQHNLLLDLHDEPNLLAALFVLPTLPHLNLKGITRSHRTSETSSKRLKLPSKHGRYDTTGNIPAIQTVHDRCRLYNCFFDVCGVKRIVVAVESVKQMSGRWDVV